ncbi:MAG: class I SAM-dependent methyltransferase [Candidatus Pacebacteria bacterium]|jgi:SAM-dependent methyltransferase|nr:class I SAM-dependent methyltransferase [Candidatus Paceibacterota bacterium]
MEKLLVNEKIQNNYDEYYKNGASQWRWLGALDKADNIVTLSHHLSIRSLIEIGAGEGAILKRLSDLNFCKEMYALEISSTGVETIINRQIPRLVECALFDGYNVPYENLKFDLAILSHVIEHVEYPRKLLYEAKRVAKYVIVEVPCEDNPRLKQDFTFDKVGHINSYSPKTIRRLIQSCNFKVLKQITVNPRKEVYIYEKGKKGLINYYIKKFFLIFSPLLATNIFTYHTALICQDDSQHRVNK